MILINAIYENSSSPDILSLKGWFKGFVALHTKDEIILWIINMMDLFHIYLEFTKLSLFLQIDAWTYKIQAIPLGYEQNIITSFSYFMPSTTASLSQTVKYKNMAYFYTARSYPESNA